MQHITLVTGATGAVGPRIVDSLLSAGIQVCTLSLDAPPTGLWPIEVDVRLGDVTDADTVSSAMQNVDSVIHLAALLHIVNPPAELRDKYERINVGGTATVVDAAVKAGVNRVVLASTIAVYGPSNGCVLDEESPTAPDSFYGQTKLAAEKIVLAARRADGQPLGTVLRFGAVYGTRVKGNYLRLLQALDSGRLMTVGNGLNRRTLIYDKDLAHAVVLTMSHSAATGQIFNITDGCFHSMQEIIATMSLALGRTPPRHSLPVKPVRWVAGILEDIGRVIGRTSPIVRATVDKYTEDIAVSGEKAQHMLGFCPQYDQASGWREIVAEMRQFGDL